MRGDEGVDWRWRGQARECDDSEYAPQRVETRMIGFFEDICSIHW